MRLVSKSAAAARSIDTAAKSRREQLLDQAARELNSKGISMTSLTDVADKLGFLARIALLLCRGSRRPDVSGLFAILRDHGAPAGRSRAVRQQRTAGGRQLRRPYLGSGRAGARGARAKSACSIRLSAKRCWEFSKPSWRGSPAYSKPAPEPATFGRCDFPIVARTIISIIHSIPLNSALGNDAARQQTADHRGSCQGYSWPTAGRADRRARGESCRPSISHPC